MISHWGNRAHALEYSRHTLIKGHGWIIRLFVSSFLESWIKELHSIPKVHVVGRASLFLTSSSTSPYLEVQHMVYLFNSSPCLKTSLRSSCKWRVHAPSPRTITYTPTLFRQICSLNFPHRRYMHVYIYILSTEQ